MFQFSLTSLVLLSLILPSTPTPSTEHQAVWLHCGFRTGSSLLGELFNRNPQSFYVFEPLFGAPTSSYSTVGTLERTHARMHARTHTHTHKHTFRIRYHCNSYTDRLFTGPLLAAWCVLCSHEYPMQCAAELSSELFCDFSFNPSPTTTRTIPHTVTHTHARTRTQTGWLFSCWNLSVFLTKLFCNDRLLYLSK
jgi:hypothetical protein